MDLACLVHAACGGDVDPALPAHTVVVSQYASALWEGWVEPHCVDAAFQAVCAKLDAAVHPWAVVTGPVGALVASLRRLGWTLESAVS